MRDFLPLDPCRAPGDDIACKRCEWPLFAVPTPKSILWRPRCGEKSWDVSGN
ncbi:MAG: hypothetical protein JWL65_6851 [Gammaproteobacteria bacterium]|nr:hypothetical protein [Gammaproteobacteria bacterium]